MASFFHRLLRSAGRPPITLTADGFSLGLDRRPPAVFQWAQAERIIAFKRDLLTTDEICIAFEYHDAAGQPMTFEVSEECPGFAAFQVALRRAFPSIEPDWYARLVKPAFATNLTVLWPAEPSPTASVAPAAV